MKGQLVPLALLTAVAVPVLMIGTPAAHGDEPETLPVETLVPDSVEAADAESRYSTLSEADFQLIARQLGVEVPAIKAVVLIEAGNDMEGFWAPGIPVINFSPTMYSRYCGKVSGHKIKDAAVPEGLKGYGLKQWTQLVNARKSNAEAADMGTFWGMFQIGGFNYKFCGCKSAEEMGRRMCLSELEQLELFAAFITNAGMLDDLKNKNWRGFARKYNGSSYAKRGYHTRMANAYAKFKKEAQ